MKTHYAYVERGNESNSYDEWSETACNRDLEPDYLTNNIKYVTCKKCLKAIEKSKQLHLNNIGVW